MARRLVFEGTAVKGVFEILPWASGLERNIRQCLMDYGIPLELGSTVIEIRGRDRVESVVVAKVDQTLAPVAGTETVIPCDTLLLSVGLIPENELAKKAGVALSPLTGGAVVDETLMTSVPGIFSCGNVLHIHDVADWASFEGFAAGARAARFAAGERPAGAAIRVSAGPDIRYALPQLVTCGKAGVEWSFRVKHPVRDVKVEIKGLTSGKVYARRKFSRLLPSELQKIKVRAAAEEDLEVGCT
jgi:pyruvate/2-oxoglutarate dehydrogenase complex dihydrolipoamide dehydrogenase (E3) component